MSQMKNNTTLIKASINELKELQTLCKTTYPIYFDEHWIGKGLELYLEEQYGTERLIADLQDENIGYFFIKYDNMNVGFVKLNYSATLEGFKKGASCELEKMYVIPAFKGKGMGTIVMNQIIDMVCQKGIRVLFLYALDTNEEAILFYKKSGFKLYGKTRLEYALFKKELRGLDIIFLEL